MAARKSEIHMHSIFSDGEFAPTELIAIGKKNGVGIMSLTDHDTFSGLPEFIDAARLAGMGRLRARTLRPASLRDLPGYL